ncbi:MAG TPA: AMMECR1 domain-containing protein [Fimbriimonas sp.]|nr:AMMECR1 domain-containing protein [Fimbriimonas sp.]
MAAPYHEQALLQIAHQAIEREVSGKPPAQVKADSPPSPVFITIERGGKVVGCRGSLAARTPSLEQEVASEARAACAHDPRYGPLTSKDLSRILVTVTVVDRMEPVGSVDGLEPSEGLVVRSGDKVGVVLPWEGKDPATRLKWAYKKAGLSEGSPATLALLIAKRFRG